MADYERILYAQVIGRAISEYRQRHGLTEKALARKLHHRFGGEWPLNESQFLWMIRRLQTAAATMKLNAFFYVVTSMDEDFVAVYMIVMNRISVRRIAGKLGTIAQQAWKPRKISSP